MDRLTTAVPDRSEGATPLHSDGVGGLLALPAFRGLLIANVLSAIGFGTSRFVFVWLVGELTEWNPATALLGILIGLPPLLLSAWAGSLADHIEPRRLGVGLFGLSAAGFGLTGLLVATDAMTVELAMLCGLLTAIAPSMIMPQMQALVPAIVPGHRLMQGVALQNLSMMVSIIAGVFLGGAVIQAFGVAAGFWLVAIAGVLGAVRFATMPLPDQAPPSDRRGAIRQGIRIGLGTEPLRSLLAITAVVGLAIATSTLLLPEFARDVLEKESLAASALNVFMSIGMMITSMLIATRWTPARPGLALTVFSVIPLGGGLIAIGASRAYVITAVVSFMWGLGGGIGMTLTRTLTQMNTPPELMGRVMGLSMMAQNGAFPIGALLLFGLVSVTSVSTAMIVVGFICVAATSLIALGPHVRLL